MNTRSVPATFDEIVREIGNSGPTVSDSLRWFTAPSDVWFRILEDMPDAAVWVAHVKSLPEDVIEVLASHPDEDVRMGIAMLGKLESFPKAHAILLADPVLRIRITAGSTDLGDLSSEE